MSGPAGRRRPPAREPGGGWIAVPVLLLALAVAATVVAEFGIQRALLRGRRAELSERHRRELLAWGWTRAVAEVRHHLQDPTAPPWRPLGVDGAASGEGAPGGEAESRVLRRWEWDPPAELRPFGPPAPSLQVRATLLRLAPLPEEPFQWCDAIARDEETGGPRRVALPLLFLPECLPAELEAAVAPELSHAEFPDTESPETEEGGQAAAELARRLVAAGDARTWQQLRAALERSLEEDPVDSAAVAEGIDAALPAVWRRLDPATRSRRTHAHLDRLDGEDRGDLDDPGPVLALSPSGRYELQVELFDDTGGREPAGGHTARGRERLVGTFAPLRRVALRSQAEFVARTPSGRVRVRGLGGSASGPEVLSDTFWELVPGPSFQIESAAAEPSGRWLPVASGLVDVWGRAILRSDGSSQPLPPGDPRFAGSLSVQLLPAGGAALLDAGGGLWLVRGGCVYGAQEATPAFRSLHLLGDDLLAVDSSGFPHVLDGCGRTVARGGSPVGTVAIALPDLERVVFPGSAPGEPWQVVAPGPRAEAWPDPIAELDLRVPGSRLTGDGARGLWWWDSEAAVLGHLSWDLGGAVRRDLPLAIPELVSEPVSELVAFPEFDLVIVRAAGGGLHACRAAAGAVTAAGSATIDGDTRALLAGRGVEPGVWRVGIDEVEWLRLRPQQSKTIEFDGHLLTLPSGLPWTDGLRALDGADLDGFMDGERLSAEGSVNSGGSTVSAFDLSDLVADGLLLSPARGETLRYRWSSLPPHAPRAERGWGAILVEVAHAAEDAPEPERERVLFRLRQLATVRFEPDAEWIAAHHPDHPSAASISSWSLETPTEREVIAESVVTRLPELSRWSHRRTVEGIGLPWLLQVWAGDPAEPLAPWEVSLGDLFPPGEASVEDSCPAARWSLLRWGWRDGTAAGIALDAQVSDEAGVLVPGDPPGAAHLEGAHLEGAHLEGAHVEAGALSTAEIGGPLVDKAFRGSVRSLRLREAPPAGVDPLAATRVTSAAGWAIPIRWRLGEPLAPGESIRRLAVEGIVPDGWTVHWSLRLTTATGGTRELSGVGREFWPRMGDAPAACAATVHLHFAPSSTAEVPPLFEGLLAEVLGSSLAARPPLSPLGWRASPPSDATSQSADEP